MLPSSRADLSTPYRELAHEDWLHVTTTGRRGRRRSASTPSPPASTCRRRPRKRGPRPRAASSSATLARPLRSNWDASTNGSSRCRRPQTRDSRGHQSVATSMSPVAATHCLHLVWIVDERSTGCPVTSMLPSRLRTPPTTTVAETRNPSRELLRPALPCLVPYRLDTPPFSPVTQRKQRLVSNEMT